MLRGGGLEGRGPEPSMNDGRWGVGVWEEKRGVGRSGRGVHLDGGNGEGPYSCNWVATGVQ